MKRDEEVVVVLDGVAAEGQAVGRADGMVVFVRGAVPGDTVQARVVNVRKNFAEARALRVISPSPDRTEARCRHFGVCGGCKWQNLAYEAQLRFKQQTVADAFQRIGGFSDAVILPVLGCASPYYYRNKMEFTFSSSRWLTEDEMREGSDAGNAIALGLHVPRRFDKVVDLQECWLQSETGSAILNAVRETCRRLNLSVYSTATHQGYLRHLVIREGKNTGERMVNLVTTEDIPETMNRIAGDLLDAFPGITTIVNNVTARMSMVALGETERAVHGPGYIHERIGGLTFRISANSFFQTNTAQAEVLYSVTSDFAGLQKEDTAYDLYCGTGTIAITLAGSGARVVGIELVEPAIRDAELNARLNGAGNCFFVQGDLKERLTTGGGWIADHPKPTVVVADPPRSGMHAKVVQRVSELGPGRIVYVSCNPTTQARDAALLVQSGYRLEKVQPVDMFPHTDHIEAVALLTREPR